MTDDHARVRVYADDKARINDRRRGDDTQADVVARLLNGDSDDPTEMDAAVWEDLERAIEGSDLSYEDVVNACKQAIREELPVEEMGH